DGRELTAGVGLAALGAGALHRLKIGGNAIIDPRVQVAGFGVAVDDLLIFGDRTRAASRSGDHRTGRTSRSRAGDHTRAGRGGGSGAIAAGVARRAGGEQE